MTQLPDFGSERFACIQPLMQVKKFARAFICWMLLGFLMAISVQATAIGVSTQSLPSPELVRLENGQRLYQNGQFLQAVNVWKSAAASFASAGDSPQQALVLSYLALTYQQLGKPEATTTMEQAVTLIANLKQPSPLIFAQILNNLGELQLNQGKAEKALETWQKSQQLYQEIGDRTGEIGTQLNQARALQVLGFSERAKTTLQQLEASLSSQADSQLKVNALLNLGNILRISGDFATSEKILQQALSIAQKLQLVSDIPNVFLSLGNLASAQGQPESALQYYQQATVTTNPVRLVAQIHQLEMLVALNRSSEAETLINDLQTQLTNLPTCQRTIYAQIELAENLLKLDPKATPTAAKILATAQKQAKDLGNPRAESYALGRLAGLYEQTQQWEVAKSLTQQALNLGQLIRAPEVVYQWQWQMGRLLVKTANINQAIAAYTEAVKNLQSLRQDLVATDQDLQLSFRESIEPVYRELVDLLLKNANTSPSQQQENLTLARKTIEDLNLAELANFFREACLTFKSQPIEEIDPTAAVIYPIILGDRLEVILSLPGQPLRHYATSLPQSQVESVIKQMRQSLRRTSFAQERLPIAQQLYTWLVQPAAADLARNSIKTLVFVLDGSLRNLPMAALYDGQQYLIEKYQVAIAPSLQLIDPRPIAQTQLRALVGGLTQGNQEFSPLPGVKEEAAQISKTIPTITLIDQNFTTTALDKKVEKGSFSVMHLATHGQFSSKAAETFILTWDQPLNVKQINTLLAKRDLSKSKPIELLVLSACQTAQGDKRAALGLAGVAVRSGVRSTLATLWTVSDQSTKSFMVRFYQELLKPKASKAEAVRLAQLYLLKKPEFNHPYYWAPFILVGNWL